MSRIVKDASSQYRGLDLIVLVLMGIVAATALSFVFAGWLAIYKYCSWQGCRIPF